MGVRLGVRRAVGVEVNRGVEHSRYSTVTPFIHMHLYARYVQHLIDALSTAYCVM